MSAVLACRVRNGIFFVLYIWFWSKFSCALRRRKWAVESSTNAEQRKVNSLYWCPMFFIFLAVSHLGAFMSERMKVGVLLLPDTILHYWHLTSCPPVKTSCSHQSKQGFKLFCLFRDTWRAVVLVVIVLEVQFSKSTQDKQKYKAFITTTTT